MPIAKFSSLPLNHWKIRGGAADSRRAPPTPTIARPLWSKTNDGAIAVRKLPRQTKTSPIMHNFFFPYLSAKNPPGIAITIAGRAIKSISPETAVWLRLKASMIAGINGGAACIENRNEKAAKKTAVNITQRLFNEI